MTKIRLSFQILGSLILMIWAASCNTDNYLHYDTNTAALRFIYQATGNDSIIYSFKLHPGTTEGTVEIPVRLVGISSSQAREISVDIIKEKSTAVENTDFIIEPSYLEPDSITGKLKLTVRKSAGLDNGDLCLAMCLKPNDHFGPSPIDQSEFRVVITNKLTMPEGWIFGDYSQIKHEFVIEHTGVATNYWQLWDNSEIMWWRNVLLKALYEYNNAHPDDPLKDENGMPITF